MPQHEETEIFDYTKTKAQISCAVTAQLISAFVFTAQIVKFISYFYPKFQDSTFFCGHIGCFVLDLVGNASKNLNSQACKFLSSWVMTLFI